MKERVDEIDHTNFKYSYTVIKLGWCCGRQAGEDLQRAEDSCRLAALVEDPS
jgi:hypothetical protein